MRTYTYDVVNNISSLLGMDYNRISEHENTAIFERKGHVYRICLSCINSLRCDNITAKLAARVLASDLVNKFPELEITDDMVEAVQATTLTIFKNTFKSLDMDNNLQRIWIENFVPINSERFEGLLGAEWEGYQKLFKFEVGYDEDSLKLNYFVEA